MYFISATRKNFKVGIVKLPVELLLLQPYKFQTVYLQEEILIRITYCIFIKDRKDAFLNNKMPGDAAFSCSLLSGIYVSCYVKYCFMVSQFRNVTVQECCELLL